MPQNKRTTLIVLSGLAAGFLLLAQFINWFETSAGSAFGSVSAGFNAWTVNFSAGGFGSTSESFIGNIGSDGSTWTSNLMGLTGLLVLAATVLAGIAILPLVQGKPALAGRLGIIAGACAATAFLFGFMYNYVGDSKPNLDLYFGIVFPLAGTVLAFTAATMTKAYGTGNVPGPTTPQTAGRPRQ